MGLNATGGRSAKWRGKGKGSHKGYNCEKFLVQIMMEDLASEVKRGKDLYRRMLKG
jgi:hypothetical protein